MKPADWRASVFVCGLGDHVAMSCKMRVFINPVGYRLALFSCRQRIVDHG